MMPTVRPSFGLIGRVVAILLFATLVEFGMSTVLYERASQFSVRDDEGRRLAEHLVIARRLMAEHPVAERSAMARSVSTAHYAMAWRTETPPPSDPALSEMRAKVLAWEPVLQSAPLRMRLEPALAGSFVAGAAALPDGSWLYFRTAEAIDSLDQSRNRILIALGIAGVVMALGGGLIGRTLRPMRLLASAADRFGTAQAAPLAEEGPAEVRRVIVAFNRMQARIQQLIADRTQALAAVGHDIRTPLARLRLRAESVRADAVRDEILDDVAEMDAMVGSLLAFLGGEDDPEKPVLADLAVLCATLADDAADHGRAVTYIGPDHLDHVFRQLGLKRALCNLVENGLHHGDHVTISLATDSGTVTACVEDDGPGIPDSQLQSVLEPFVRLDTARRRDTQGLGLGLAIVLRAVELEKGGLLLSNRPQGGLRAEIRLPRAL
ncbi:ATP-binding protein [Sphingomonas sp. TREG-RG-20F-R18-01]|uniref:ATP-binding protein n=1 Tax=Sphingomonas sp. TREG-RG-20F-R18-01 TaxID=2914982 RepID=UPI001F58C928|nr:ATP-binding protein [Sphingomonas sp. TREG-RG-20F-R18-01]